MRKPRNSGNGFSELCFTHVGMKYLLGALSFSKNKLSRGFYVFSVVSFGFCIFSSRDIDILEEGIQWIANFRCFLNTHGEFDQLAPHCRY